MTKYFLNIRQSGKEKKDNEQTYEFDLETPLLFPSAIGEKKREYNHLKIKTQQDKNQFFRDANHKIDIISGLSPIETYWNLCVPDDNKGFSLLADNDKLTLGDEEGKIYLELFHFPIPTLTVKPRAIFTIVKGESLNITIEPFKTQEGIEVDQLSLEGEKFTNSNYQSLIQNIIDHKKELKFSFCPNNSTYFSKTYCNSKENNVLVIPENSLEEDLTTQNNPSSTSKSLYFFLAGTLILAFLFLVLWLIKLRKSRKN